MTDREKLIIEVFSIVEEQTEAKARFDDLEQKKQEKLMAIKALKESTKTE